MLQVIAIQTRWNTKRLTKEFYRQNLVVRHVTEPCTCMTTSIIIKITRVISMWTPHWITVSYHGVEGPMTTGYYVAIFPFCGGGKKKRQKNKGILWQGYHRYPRKKNKGIYDWATTGITVKNSHLSHTYAPLRPSWINSSHLSIYIPRFPRYWRCTHHQSCLKEAPRRHI